MVEKFRIKSAEEAFLGRPEARLSSRALMFAHPIQSQQLLEIHTVEFRAAINHNGAGQSPIALDAQTERHHAGSVTGLVKGQVVGCDPPRMGEDEQRQPTLAQRLTSARV